MEREKISEEKYEHLATLLALCVTSGLVRADPEKGTWVATTKFLDLIEDAVGKITDKNLFGNDEEWAS